MEKDRLAIGKLLDDYSRALIDGNAASLASLYCGDAEFMPDGFPTIRGAQQIKKSAEAFFQNRALKAEFSLNNVVVERNFAFVDSTATIETYRDQEKSFTTKTRDFFVLERRVEDWKIFRYIFNKI